MEIYSMEEKYQEYLIDESKYEGYAESISFPKSQEEALEVVRYMADHKIPITIQGGKTGIVGGAVPRGGHIMNLSSMKRCLDYGEDEKGCYIEVEPGMNLMELKGEIARNFRKKSVFWPPMPTETSATVGGILASNARGINGCRFGDSRRYVRGISLLQGDGTIREITWGNRSFLVDGRQIDELDMILGGEGIYGAITRATLCLLPRAEEVWGITFFFETEEAALSFGEMAKQSEDAEGAYIEAMEYMDRPTIDLIQARKATMTKIKDLPDVKEEYRALVYVEIRGEEDPIEMLAGTLMELVMECGSDPDEAWAVSGEGEVEKMHAFRHGAAETANLHIEEMRREDGRILKLGTDMALEEERLSQVVAMYRQGMEEAGLKGCIFGHMTDNHLHVNLLPESYEEYERGEELLRTWIMEGIRRKGIVTAEHGIGKRKRAYTTKILSRERMEAMQILKKECDPENLWNRGNIFEESQQEQDG